MTTAEIGVFGGLGVLLVPRRRRARSRSRRRTASRRRPLVVGEIGGSGSRSCRATAASHELPPHRIPYRANVWAMRELGVRRIIGPCASGALRADLELGEFVVCDQFVDRTTGRADTFYDGPETTHVSAADPYCPDLRAAARRDRAASSASRCATAARSSSIQGPRFSTRAESQWFQDAGWDVINMTAYPEGYLARELELCYANISMVTDHDVGVEGAEPVSHEAVLTVFAREQRAAARAAVRGDPEDRAAAGGRVRDRTAGRAGLIVCVRPRPVRVTRVAYAGRLGGCPRSSATRRVARDAVDSLPNQCRVGHGIRSCGGPGTRRRPVLSARRGRVSARLPRGEPAGHHVPIGRPRRARDLHRARLRPLT